MECVEGKNFGPESPFIKRPGGGVNEVGSQSGAERAYLDEARVNESQLVVLF